jgi:hypothetical protein
MTDRLKTGNKEANVTTRVCSLAFMSSCRPIQVEIMKTSIVSSVCVVLYTEHRGRVVNTPVSY